MSAWNLMPFARLILPFTLGIWLELTLALPLDFANHWVLLPPVVMLFTHRFTKLFGAYQWRKLTGVLCHLLVFWTGLICAHLSLSHPAQPNDVSEWHAEIIEAPLIKTKTVQLLTRLRAIGHQAADFDAEIQGILYLEKDSLAILLGQGDRLVLAGSPSLIKAPMNPGAFDYRKWMASKGVHHSLYVTRDKWQLLNTPHGKSIRNFFEDVREKLRTTLLTFDIRDSEYAVISALVLGQRDDLDPELKNAFATAGAMHVLAVSGLHVGLIYLVAIRLLKLLFRKRRNNWIQLFIVVLLLWFYAALTGLSPSVLRAATMFTCIAVGETISRNSNTYNTLAASAFILLAIDPPILFQVGFQLSYIAVLGIVFLQPKLYALLPTQPWLLDKIWQLTTVSLAAQLATFPLGLYYFEQFPTYFLLSNFVAIPLATLILYSCLVFFVASFIPLIGEPVAWLLKSETWLLNKSILAIESLPSSKATCEGISLLDTVGLYVVMLMVILFFLSKRFYHLLIALVAVIVILGYSAYSQHVKPNFSFIIHSANQHSAITLAYGETGICIADSALWADSNVVKYSVDPVFKVVNIKKLDSWLITQDSELSTSFSSFHSKVLLTPVAKVFVLDKPVPNCTCEHALEVDLVLLRTTLKDLDSYKNCLAYSRLILDGSMPTWERDKVKGAADRLPPIYDVMENGALILTSSD